MPDELDPYISEQMKDPEFAVAYRAAQLRPSIEPTETERRQATALYLGCRGLATRRDDAERAIAQALADQRARYEAVADAFAGASSQPFLNDYDRGVAATYGVAADRIREVSRG